MSRPVKPFSQWTPEEIDAHRRQWRDWSEQHEREKAERRAAAIRKRAEERRANRQALVVASQAQDGITIDDESPIYALEVIRRHAKDVDGLPVDWRLLKPTLTIRRLLDQQPEWRHPDASQLDQRIAMLRQLLPRELDAALNAIIRGFELRAEAREAMAFSLGYAVGHERAHQPVSRLKTSQVRTSAHLQEARKTVTSKDDHGPLQLMLGE